MFGIRKINERATLLLISIVFSLLLITSNYFCTTNFVYGQPDQIKPNNNTDSLNIQNIPVKKVHVGDIDIAYKTFGKVTQFYLLVVLGVI